MEHVNEVALNCKAVDMLTVNVLNNFSITDREDDLNSFLQLTSGKSPRGVGDNPLWVTVCDQYRHVS